MDVKQMIASAVAKLTPKHKPRRLAPTNTALIANTATFPDFSTWTRQRARAAARWGVFVEIFKKHGRATDRSIQYPPAYTRRARRLAARTVANAFWRHIQPPHIDLTN